MNVLVLGLGRMGQAVSYCMKKFGHTVTGFDSRQEAIEDCIKLGYINHSMNDAISRPAPVYNIIISCLPYHKNYEWAYWAVTNGMRYCDLGGSVPVENQINELAMKYATKPVFQALGLAPGLVNILAENEFDKFPAIPTDVHLYCGGLCGDFDFPMYYRNTWSLEGLINEYTDDCEILENGKIIKVPALSNITELYSIYHDEKNKYREYYDYEAAFTSGGLSKTARLMQERGVKNCTYNTLRTKGHYQMIKFLQKTIPNKEQFKEFIKIACKALSDDKDKVIIAIRINRGSVFQCYDFIEFQEDINKFSAMQKLTGGTIACVADMMVSGIWDDIKILDYSYIIPHFEKFNENLKKLEIYI